MDRLLDLSTNLYLIGSIFLITLILLHYFLVFTKPLTLKQWKLAEYVWVGLALISIVGVLEEAKFLRANQNVERSRVLAEDKLQAIENWFDVYGVFACDEQGAKERSPKLCTWMKVKSSDLALILSNESFPPDIPFNMLSGIDEITGGIQDADRKIIKGYLNDYIAARQSYMTGVTSARRSSLSALIVSLAPILFAMAVALKFTKVTGEYRLTASRK
ncbi:hypothetical protein [Kordiimonas aquimaris]|uniref:hypothetical protein n=1 Tax=Kordiimonas aquimaris TaxID=707591 RepID=UPI0021D07990|nr:hypothetical protein [Kordiimonas aquimaris]